MYDNNNYMTQKLRSQYKNVIYYDNDLGAYFSIKEIQYFLVRISELVCLTIILIECYYV